MPIADIIVKGVTSTATANFISFVPSTAPTWKIYDFNNKAVASGTASLVSSAWTATFTIPNAAPNTPPNQKYSILWSAVNNGINYKITDRFTVTDSIEQPPTDAAVLALETTSFKVSFVSIYPTLTAASVRIVFNNLATALYSSSVSNMNGVQTKGGYLYVFNIPNTDSTINAGSDGLATAYAIINYLTPSNEPVYEVQPVYIVNMIALDIMNKVRRTVDRLRNNHVIPQLRFTEIDAMHFTVEGLSRVNAMPPPQITFSFRYLPANMVHYVSTAAQIAYLRAQFLGEGMASFDFNGMAVSLTSDKTQYIQGLLSELQNDMEPLERTKITLAKQGQSGNGRSIGTIGTVFGPTKNWIATNNLIGNNNQVGFTNFPFWV